MPDFDGAWRLWTHKPQVALTRAIGAKIGLEARHAEPSYYRPGFDRGRSTSQLYDEDAPGSLPSMGLPSTGDRAEPESGLSPQS